MMAELFGKATGLCGGKGGSMHVADPALGILGANAIVGAGMPIAVGAALASKLRGQGRVAVAFFGEGAVNQGAFHEALNLAAVWDLPVLFLCENNLYAEFTRQPHDDARAARRRARAGLRHRRPSSSTATTSRPSTRPRAAPSARCRDGDGPALIEADDLPLARPLRGRRPALQARGRGRRAGRDRDPLARRRREHRRARARRPRRDLAELRERRRRSSRPPSSRPRRRTPRARGGLRACLRRLSRSATSTPINAGARRRDGGRRARRPDRHRRRRWRRHLHRHPGPARALRRRRASSTRRSARWATSAPRSARR